MPPRSPLEGALVFVRNIPIRVDLLSLLYLFVHTCELVMEFVRGSYTHLDHFYGS
jgi:hypothetical protein